MTLDYLRLTGRDDAHVKIVEAYAKEQGLFWNAKAADPVYTTTIELDLSTVEPSLAGPKRPQDRVSLRQAKYKFQQALELMFSERKPRTHSRQRHARPLPSRRRIPPFPAWRGSTTAPSWWRQSRAAPTPRTRV